MAVREGIGIIAILYIGLLAFTHLGILAAAAWFVGYGAFRLGLAK